MLSYLLLGILLCSSNMYLQKSNKHDQHEHMQWRNYDEPKTTTSYKIFLNHSTISPEPHTWGFRCPVSGRGSTGQHPPWGNGVKSPKGIQISQSGYLWTIVISVQRKSQALPSSFQGSEEACTCYSISGVCKES